MTELKEQREKQKKQAEILRAQRHKEEETEEPEEDIGCSWGMGTFTHEQCTYRMLPKQVHVYNTRAKTVKLAVLKYGAPIKCGHPRILINLAKYGKLT